MKEKTKIGIIGSRGIPNIYGGFEQLAEYLSKGLMEKGFEVTVYNPHFHQVKDRNWNGIKRILCFDPEPFIGPIGHFIYDFLCILNARKHKFDVILQLGYTTNAIWYWLLPSKAKIITNMDGMEWQRSKYSPLIQKFLRFSEKLAVKSSHFLVSDSPVIQKYYLENYGRESTYIPYGVNQKNRIDPYKLSVYNLSIKSYMLIIARLQQDNNIEMIIRGFLNSKAMHSLIIVGNYRNRYGRYLVKKYKSDRIQFLGGIYDKTELDLLRSFSFLYFHGHSCGGTNPSLLEAMAASASIIAHDNPFNRYILKENALYFKDSSEISEIINRLHHFSNPELFSKSQFNLIEVHKHYSWDKIIDDYKKLILKSLSVNGYDFKNPN